MVVYLLECEQKFQPGTKLHALHKYVKATLKLDTDITKIAIGSGNIAPIFVALASD